MILYSLAGLIVGLLVGLTGMGGGLIMTPLLVLFFGVNPSIAIGTDLVYAGITKLFGFWQHWKQKTIDIEAVKWLAITSVPGSIISVVFIKYISVIYDGDKFETIIEKILAITFIVISTFMISKMIFGEREIKNLTRVKLMIMGLFGGALVGLTSVGSGSLFIALLSSFGTFTPIILVGTDIAHAAILTLSAGLTHSIIGNVDFKIVFYLLLGSIPGILIGSILTIKIPLTVLRFIIIIMLFATGVKML